MKIHSSVKTCTVKVDEMEEMSACYRKPFNLFYYNKPKLPNLRKRKGPINIKAPPKVPIRMTNAAKMRNKVISEYMSQDLNPYVDYKKLANETGKLIMNDPQVVPHDTKTSQFRYKWVREVPVVSCRFTEHVMMYKKPPFSYEKPTGRCGQYRLRNMEIKDPEIEPEPEVEDINEPLIPGILV